MLDADEREMLLAAKTRIRELEDVVRQQGEFIQSMKEMIADFVYGPERASLGRLNGGR